MKPNSFPIIYLTLIYVYFIVFMNCFNVDTQFPIVFQSRLDQNIENYFGLSVEMQSINSEVIFLIGSPKTNSSLYNVRQSGTVFKCRLFSDQNTNCEEIYIDFRRISSNRSPHKNIEIMATDDMFLGGTIVSRPNTSQAAVCGHKWSQQLYINRPEHQINPSGSCFLIDLSKPNGTLLGIFPLTEIGLQNMYSTYYYSHSMSGFSATFTSEGQQLLLGAPGFYQWRGTFLETNPIDSKLNQLIGEQFLLQRTRFLSNTESYAGYSIVSGNFLSGIQNSVAIGAPRDNNHRGKVYIYNLRNGIHSEDSTVMFTHIDGLQIGEYFGSSLLSVNLNNDQFSDLIIGAPFYSSKESGDCGRVFVYLSNGNGFKQPVVLSGSGSSGARFGTALAHLGDLNFDGYNDIAIGAPYEDQRGVVYIYFGSKNGVVIPMAQKISAKENLREINLKGFGISISGNKDIDSNHYNDIIIGSYLSNKAILLRTKPIVNMNANIEFNSTFININEKNCEYMEPNTRIQRRSACIELTYCVRYGGSYVPSKLYFNFTLLMDSRRPENPRCFTVHGNQLKTQLSKVQEISANRVICSDLLYVFLKDSTAIDDIFTPIEFSLSSSVVNIQQTRSFCKNCPIIERNQKFTNQLHLKTGCKTDEKCVSTLKLFTGILLNGIPVPNVDSIFEGFHKNLTFITSVVNTGEPSYLTKIVISSNPKLNLLKQDTRCHLIKSNSLNETSNSIECDVGNPLNPNIREEVFIPLDISQMGIKTDRLEIDIEVKTASEVTKDSHLSENFEFSVIRSASLEIFGFSNVSEILYESENQRKTDLIPFSGIFQINKLNWSSIQNVLIEIQIPSLFNKQPLLYQPVIDKPTNAHNRGVSVNCNQTIAVLPSLPLKSSDKTKYRFKRDINENQNKRTLKLDCKSHISCQTIKCFSGPFDSERQIARYLIYSALNIKTIESIFGKKYDEIQLIIKTKATILDQKIVSNSAQISTTFLFKRIDLKKETIDNWILFVSIGAGLLILVIIIILLWKFGFFKRNKLEEEEDKSQLNSQKNDKTERNSLLDFDEKSFENNGQELETNKS